MIMCSDVTWQNGASAGACVTRMRVSTWDTQADSPRGMVRRSGMEELGELEEQKEEEVRGAQRKMLMVWEDPGSRLEAAGLASFGADNGDDAGLPDSQMR
ncbi:hypothetical protein CMUS01_07447 [Colletotrichum musicola]|uniref:Uncharacterized protein n=1 Tax=Colletotrichum musicola TaxID=2175873 RepID=A0A8H6NF68_9PEZI|nr:hypothetical protein CMUS01_07447 [Colletotrichum musicola]